MFSSNLDRNCIRNILARLPFFAFTSNYLYKTEIDCIVSQIKSLFANTAKKTFKKHVVVSTKPKMLNLGLVCNVVKPKENIIQPNGIILSNNPTPQ